jgi:hypothetical protein
MTYNALSKSWVYNLLPFLLLFFAFQAQAQKDTTITEDVKVEKGQLEGDVEEVKVKGEEKLHSPKKAAILSAVLPGAGQIYNNKWWKVPIIYGGFAVAGYFLHDNLQRIELYKDSFVALTDGDPTTMNNTGFNSQQLTQLIDQYKQWRDLSYIAIGAIYILNIIDANVDAHLFYFEVNEDISMDVTPYFSPLGNRNMGLAFRLKL